MIQSHLISEEGLLVTVRGNITSKWPAKAITRVHIATIHLGDKPSKGLKSLLAEMLHVVTNKECF